MRNPLSSITWQGAKRLLAASVVFLAAGAATVVIGSDRRSSPARWTFLDMAPLSDLGLVAHGERGGIWELADHPPATGGRALANHPGEPGAAPAVLVATRPRSRDLRTTTRCKVIPTSRASDSSTPAACGVVFRFVDEKNYWVVRADFRAGSLETATVVGGREHVLKQSPVPTVSLGEWVDLDVDARGDLVRVSLDGKETLVANASLRPAGSGLIGLWAPSEATVLFDDFAFETFAPTPGALEILPLLGHKPG